MSEDRATYRTQAAMGETLHADAVAQLRAEIVSKPSIPPLAENEDFNNILSRLRKHQFFEHITIDRIGPKDKWEEKDGWDTLLELDPNPQWLVRVYLHDGLVRWMFEGRDYDIEQALRVAAEDVLAWPR